MVLISRSDLDSSMSFDSLVFVGVRVVYVLICRRFLLSALNPTLRDLSKDEDALPTLASTRLRPGLERNNSLGLGDEQSDFDTEDDGLLSRGSMTPSVSYPSSPAHGHPDLPIDTPTRASGSTPVEMADLGQRLNEHVIKLDHGRPRGGGLNAQATKRATRGLGRISKYLFCVCFAESCNLLTLVATHAMQIFPFASLRANFSFSLHALLSLILLVVPMVQCMLLTYRTTDSTSSATKRTSISLRSRILVGCIPFALYCFMFTFIPPYVTSASPLSADVPVMPVNETMGDITGMDLDNVDNLADLDMAEGWEGEGWLASTLGRVVVLGVVTLAGLSGFGAMRTAWNFIEHRRHGKSESISDADVQRAEQSLYRVRQELTVKRDELSRRRSGPSSSWMVNKLFGNKGDPEVHGLEAMEMQVTRSLKGMKRRKRQQEFSQTLVGRLYSLLGYAFGIYCGARLLMCVPTLFFPPRSNSQPGRTTNGDWISYLIALGLSHLPVDVDINVSMWSRTISLVLTGLLILSSLAQILRSVSKIVRLTSRTAGAGFLILSLGQLFSVYVISLLVQLRTSLPTPTSLDPSVPDPTARQSLLSTLPDFQTFGRLFDITFLLASGGTAVYRYIALKINDIEDVPYRES